MRHRETWLVLFDAVQLGYVITMISDQLFQDSSLQNSIILWGKMKPKRRAASLNINLTQTNSHFIFSITRQSNRVPSSVTKRHVISRKGLLELQSIILWHCLLQYKNAKFQLFILSIEFTQIFWHFCQGTRA